MCARWVEGASSCRFAVLFCCGRPLKRIPATRPAVFQHRWFVLTSPSPDHNNGWHSSAAGVCQSEERRQAGREASTQPVSTRGAAASVGGSGGVVKVKFWGPESSALLLRLTHTHTLGSSAPFYWPAFFNPGLIGLLLKHSLSLLITPALICLNYGIKI